MANYFKTGHLKNCNNVSPSHVKRACLIGWNYLS